MLSVTLLSVFLSHFFDDFSAGTTRPQRAANFYKRFHENLLFLSLSPSLPPSLPPSHLYCRKHEGTSAKVTVAAEYQFQLDTSTHCQGASLRERTPSVCIPQADPPAREGERKRANSDALLIQWWHGCGGLARPPACPVMTSPPLGLISVVTSATQMQKRNKAHSHLLLINAGGLCTYVHRKSLNN